MERMICHFDRSGAKGEIAPSRKSKKFRLHRIGEISPVGRNDVPCFVHLQTYNRTNNTGTWAVHTLAIVYVTIPVHSFPLLPLYETFQPETRNAVDRYSVADVSFRQPSLSRTDYVRSVVNADRSQ